MSLLLFLHPYVFEEAAPEVVASGGHFLPKKKRKKKPEQPAVVYIFPQKTELPPAPAEPVLAPEPKLPKIDQTPSGPTIAELQAQMMKVEYDLALAQKAQQEILHQWIAKDLTNRIAKQRLWEARQEEARLMSVLESFKARQRAADDELLLSMMLLL